MTKTVTIAVPVYADWPSLSDCIESLKKYVDGRHKVILVNDVGPEVDLMEKNIKQAINGRANFQYFRNDKNLGFVKTCNRAALELDTTDNDLLLLNSDTKVTEGFLEEMLEVLYSSGKIGAVTPRTNNATIATVPLSAMKQKGIEPAKSFAAWQKLKQKLARYQEVPTAHGFCILIRRSLIKKFGLFDEVFGKGYGEEVDFCQRIKKQGYKNVLANRAYVFHLEARSFSLEQKAQLIKESTKIIIKRYPDYQKDVASYIKQALATEEDIHPTKAQLSNLLKVTKFLISRSAKVEKLVRKMYSRFKK